MKIFVHGANCLCHPSPCCQLHTVLEVFLNGEEFPWKENNLVCTFGHLNGSSRFSVLLWGVWEGGGSLKGVLCEPSGQLGGFEKCFLPPGALEKSLSERKKDKQNCEGVKQKKQ